MLCRTAVWQGEQTHVTAEGDRAVCDSRLFREQ